MFLSAYKGKMRNEITAKAVKAAGGVKALSDLLGISQPAVTAWKRVPASRVLVVEKITGISRHKLRPDVFGRKP
jgi:DNA-binding transcriptional regulator YdaS (Cro superfamily)